MYNDVWIQALGFSLAPSATPPAVSTARYTVMPSAAFSQSLGEALQPREAAVAGPAPYVVQKGDYLAKIVQAQLKSLGREPVNSDVYDGVRKVAEANGLANPDVLHPGQKLDLSVLAAPSDVLSAKRSTEAPTPSPPALAAAAVAPVVSPTASSSLPTSSATYSTGAVSPQGGPLMTASLGKLGVRGEISDRVRTDLSALIERILNPGASKSSVVKGTSWAALSAPAELSSGFGMREDPFTGRLAFHQGVDLATDSGTTVYPIQSGTVTFSGYDSGYGRMVVVKHANGLESVYGHNSEVLVKRGDQVTRETPLSLVGTTGRSKGPHLHLEVRKHNRPVNPLPYLREASDTLADKS